jgi:hypothetical protein
MFTHVLPPFLEGLQTAYVNTGMSSFDEQILSQTSGTSLERVASAVLNSIPQDQLNWVPWFEHTHWGFLSTLKRVAGAIENTVSDVVRSTPPSMLDSQQRCIVLCNLLGFSYRTLTLKEKNFIYKVVTSSSLSNLERLFSRNSDNDYEFPCCMFRKKKWTIIHFICFMFTVQQHMLRGYLDDNVPSEDDYIQELQNSEHRLFVQIEMHKLYLICVERGIFSHTPSPPPSPPTSL